MNKIKILIGFVLSVSMFQANSQTVSTYAGKQYLGNGNYSGVSSSPLATEYYSELYGICLDTNRRIYVSDQHNVSILTNGNSYTRGGYLGDPLDAGGIGTANGTGTVSRFATPAGLTVKKSDNSVFVCDKDNSTIRRGTAYVNSSQGSIWTTFAGVSSFLGGYKDGSATVAEFSSPYDIAITSNGTIYVSDFGNDCIRKISGTTVSTIAGLGQATGDADGVGSVARFDSPCGLYLEDDNNLLITDRNNGKIKRLNLTTGAVTTLINGLTAPTDVVYLAGVYYIVDQTCIKQWSVGNSVTILCGSATENGYEDGNYAIAKFGELDMLTVDPVSSVLYVCDKGNNVVRKISLSNSAIADFTASKTTPTRDETIILTSTSQFATNQTWSITPGTYTLQGGSKLTDPIIYVSFSVAQSYSVQLIATNSSSSNTKLKNNYINVSINTNATPVANFMATKTNPVVNEQIELIDMSANSPSAFMWEITPSAGWNVTSGTSVTSKNPKITFISTGVYTIKLTSTNSNGSHSTTKTNYITVGANGVKDISYNLGVYPNPTSDFIYFQNVNNNLVKLLNNTGQVLYSGNTNSIDLSNFPSGIYTVQIVDDNSSKTAKIIKQ